MSYSNEAAARATVEKALRKVGGAASYEPLNGLYDLLGEVESLWSSMTYSEVMEALRDNEPALHAATVEMLVELYLETVETDCECLYCGEVTCQCAKLEMQAEAEMNEDDEIEFR